jgi:hypothetical protein
MRTKGFAGGEDRRHYTSARLGGQSYSNQPFSISISSNDHGVPERVHLGAAAVHGPSQPRMNSSRTIAVSISQQLFVNP